MSKTSRLPATYLAARNALRACDRHFTPEAYSLAAIALAGCLASDEVTTWPQDTAALDAYCRMARDNELMRLAARVEKKRADWRAQRDPALDET